MAEEKHECTLENAPKFRDWIKNRGGILIWESVNLSNPGMSWSTPAWLEGTQQPYPKPSWQAANTPARHITSEADVLVLVPKEVKRFYVAVRQGSQGMMLKVTDGGTRRIRSAVAKAGEHAWYEFDYATQHAVILKPGKIIPLNEWNPPPPSVAPAAGTPIDTERQ